MTAAATDSLSFLAAIGKSMGTVDFDQLAANYRPNDATAEEDERYLADLRTDHRLKRAALLRDLKLEALRDEAPITLTTARSYVALCDEFSILSVILGLRPYMARPGWLALLGENWTYYPCIGRYIEDLRPILPARGPVLEMMTAKGRARYAALPQSMTVYRGCGSDESIGICWSLQREIAERFRTFPGYEPVGNSVLLTATVEKTEVLALRLDRDEEEVITFGARIISTEALAEPSWRTLAATTPPLLGSVLEQPRDGDFQSASQGLNRVEGWVGATALDAAHVGASKPAAFS